MRQKDIKNGMRVTHNFHDVEGIAFYFRDWGVLFIADEPGVNLYYHNCDSLHRTRVMKICPQFKSHEDFTRRCWWTDAGSLDPLPIDLDEDDNECV